ncbi:MAG: hypothetical protein ABI650_09925 [Dokdonella sp.]
MRYLICFAIGILIGALVAVTTASIMSHRNAYPRALMRVMQTQLLEARDAARDRTCTDNLRRLQTLDLLARDISRAVHRGAEVERTFTDYNDRLSEAIAHTTAQACAAQTDALTAINNACEDCHRDYR